MTAPADADGQQLQRLDREERSRRLAAWYERWAAGQDAADPRLEGLPPESAFADVAGDDFHEMARHIMGLPALTPVTAALSGSELEEFNIKHPRGFGGKFGHGGGVVRGVIAAADSIEQLNEVLRVALRAVMGRHVSVSFAGCDLEIAKQYAEGVLLSAQRFPGNRLSAVWTAGPNSRWPDLPLSYWGLDANSVYAFASRQDKDRTAIFFNTHLAADPEHLARSYENDADVHHSTTPGAIGTAVHEMGHVIATHSPGAETAGRLTAKAMAAEHGVKPAAFVRGQVSAYASTNQAELVAEAFADVILNGDDASPLSHRIFDALEAAYRGEPMEGL